MNKKNKILLIIVCLNIICTIVLCAKNSIIIKKIQEQKTFTNEEIEVEE